MGIMKCVMLYVLSKLDHDFDDVVVLQNCMDMLKSEPGSSTEKHIMLSNDVNQVAGTKAEEVSVVKMEEGSETSSSFVVKTEPVVSCMFVCIECYAH
jgi:hypothetical protein